jgi:hypothetical protein
MGKGSCPLIQCAGLDGGTHFGHDHLIEMQVVDGVEHPAEDFAMAEEVVQVGAGELRAGIASAR